MAEGHESIGVIASAVSALMATLAMLFGGLEAVRRLYGRVGGLEEREKGREPLHLEQLRTQSREAQGRAELLTQQLDSMQRSVDALAGALREMRQEQKETNDSLYRIVNDNNNRITRLESRRENG